MTELAIATICRDNPEGLERTLASTDRVRSAFSATQYVIDGSSAAHRGQMQAIALKHPGVQYQWQEAAGTANAYNLALKTAVEPWFWILNSGDELIPEFNLDLLFELMSRSSATVLTLSIIDQDGAVTRRPSLPFMWPPVFCWLCLLASVIRTKDLQAIGGFDPEFPTTNDAEMWFRLLNQRHVTLDVISMPMVRMEAAGLSGNRAVAAAEAIRMIASHKGMIFKRWVQSGMRYFEAKRKYGRRMRTPKTGVKS